MEENKIQENKEIKLKWLEGWLDLLSLKGEINENKHCVQDIIRIWAH